VVGLGSVGVGVGVGGCCGLSRLFY